MLFPLGFAQWKAPVLWRALIMQSVNSHSSNVFSASGGASTIDVCNY